MATKAVFFALGALAVLDTSSSALDIDVDVGSLSKLSVFAALTDDPQCQGQELTCADCTNRVICARLGKAWLNIYNDTCSGENAYCLNGTCQATIPASCNTPPEQPADASFLCPGDGYWPDLTSCTRYFFCTNDLAYRQDCSAYPNTVYDQASAMCVTRTRAPCYTLACPAPGSFQVYTPDPRIYALCRTRNVADAVTASCDDGEAMNVSSKKCEPTCLKAGRFAVGGDDKKYIECVDLGGGRLSKPIPGECPGDATFGRSTQRCLPVAASTATTQTPSQSPSPATSP